MSIFEALILGAVQGLTEFLPVSSSGHLVLLQKIFGINEPVLLFDTLVHAGTLAAVCAVLWKDIWEILRRLNQPLTLFLIIATIPAVIAALLFSRQIETAFATASLLGFFFLVTSLLLLLAELLGRRKTMTGAAGNQSAAAEKKTGPMQGLNGEKMTWVDALTIGLLQALAILPGISRSGATLSAGLFRRLEREFAVRFSFLLSIPVILGSLVFQLKDLFGDSAGSEFSGGTDFITLAAGTVIAAIVGYFSIRLMLKIVRERSLLGFAAYTGILGILVLIDRFALHLFF